MNLKPLSEIERNRAILRIRIYESLMAAFILIWLWLGLDALWIKWLPLSWQVVITISLIIIQIPLTIRLNNLAKEIDRSDRYYRLRKQWFK